jgi:hypothetical protein
MRLMPNQDTIKLVLTIVSGLCWTIVYIDGIRVGLRDKSYAIPFYALALNFAWELLYTILGFRSQGAQPSRLPRFRECKRGRLRSSPKISRSDLKLRHYR